MRSRPLFAMVKNSTARCRGSFFRTPFACHCHARPGSGVACAFPVNFSLRTVAAGSEKFLASPLETKIDFFYFPLPPRGGVPDAFMGQGLKTGTGCVRCLIPILLFGGFGYAHL